MVVGPIERQCAPDPKVWTSVRRAGHRSRSRRSHEAELDPPCRPARVALEHGAVDAAAHGNDRTIAPRAAIAGALLGRRAVPHDSTVAGPRRSGQCRSSCAGRRR